MFLTSCGCLDSHVKTMSLISSRSIFLHHIHHNIKCLGILQRGWATYIGIIALQNLPTEMLLLIASHLETEIDINSLSQANRRLHNTLDPYIYKQNVKKSNGSALSYAALSGKPSTAHKALNAGADISNIDSFVNNENKKKNHGNDIHMLINDAAIGGSLVIFNLFLESAASALPDFDIHAVKSKSSAWTLLFDATYAGSAEIVRALLEMGFDPNARDQPQRIPLHVACMNGHAAVVDVLLAHPNTDVNAQNNSGETPLVQAARSRGYAEIVEKLLAHGAHAGVKKGELTSLHCAVMHRKPELVRLLVGRQEVNPNALYGEGTALQWAVERDREDMVELLLSDKRTNPDFNLSENGETLLLQSLIKGNDRMARAFFNAGANPNIASRTWLTPAMLLEAPSEEARQELVQQYHSSEEG